MARGAGEGDDYILVAACAAQPWRRGLTGAAGVRGLRVSEGVGSALEIDLA